MLLTSADAPVAVLPPPVVFERSAYAPAAVLVLPVVLKRRANVPFAVFKFPEVLLPSADAPVAVLLSPSMLFPSASRPIAVFVAVVPAPFPTVIPLTDKSELNVFAPAKVCAAVVTIPGFVSSAGVSFNSPAVIVAALAVDELLIVPTDVIPTNDTPAGHVPDFGPKIVLVVVLI